MEFSWLEDIWSWIVNNPLFSGAGGTVLAVIIGGIFRKRQYLQQTTTVKKM